MLIHGVDLVNTTRNEFTSPTIYKRILHLHEYPFYVNLPDAQKTSFLAKYWAIKEAIFKALPNKIALHQIEIKKDYDTYVYVHAQFDFSISISYCDQYILASVIGFKKTCSNW